jgi:acyl-CoA dehydrogenase
MPETRMNLDHLDWPFFDDPHQALATGLGIWVAAELSAPEHDDVDAACRDLVRRLGDAGWLRYCVPASHGGALAALDSRALCVARETLAYADGLADFVFAMQGLGSGPITLAGSPAQKARWLPAVAKGKAIAAFALSEPEAGSDVGAMTTTARRDGDSWVIDGTKTWISNGGIADFYCVFARAKGTAGPNGISAFIVPAHAPGLSIAERIEVIAPHPLARLKFDGVRVPVANRLGKPGEGFKVAMATLDIFRSSVGAAALGFARRGLFEMVERAAGRKLFGAPLADLQLTQAAIADSATEVDASALLVYRAAWHKDQGAPRVTREAAMAKMFATEAAQRVIDRAVQVHGGLGVTRGVKVEELYREIRALRIYEGATEVQKLVIARETMKLRADEAALAAE